MPNELLEITKKTMEYSGWKEKVENKGTFSIPEDYGIAETTNKYTRFTSYFRSMVEELFVPNEEANVKSETMLKWISVKEDHTEIKDGWWEDAQKLGTGSNIESNNVPQFRGGATEEGKKLVYDSFIPAYRAIKESFDKRSIFQWIFNHRQYTAERDVLNALKGLMINLTGDSKEVIDLKVQEHKALVPSNNINENVAAYNLKNAEIESNIRQQEFDKIENERRLESERIERENEEIKQQIQESKKNEVEEISMKKAEDLTTQDKYKILSGDDTFKQNVQKELLEKVKRSTFKETMTKTLINNNVYTGLMELAQNFCMHFDNAKENGENLEGIVEQNVKDIFKLAFTRVGLFKPTLKDRLIMAQAMTDVIVKSATPVGFEEKTYGKYAQNYVLKNDEEFVRSVIRSDKSINVSNLDNDIKDVKNELGIVEVKEERIQMNIDELKEGKSEIVSSQHEEVNNSKIIVNDIK